MGDYINDIKSLILEYIKNEYKNYLSINKLLLIDESNIYNIISRFYYNNIKELKPHIRNKMREKYKENYPNATIENILFDLTQDNEKNIELLIKEITYIQNINYCNLEIPIINDSLNLNISNDNNYIIINYIKDNSDTQYNKIYDKLMKYKFIYSINDKLLHNYSNDEKINIIKDEVKNKINVNLGVYYLNSNIESL